MTDYNVTEIESMTEDQARELSEDTMQIKGYTIYFLNLGSYFGYSVMVFKNNHQIYYANDYQLHNEYKMKNEGKEALRAYYIESLNNKLFTEEEIKAPIKDYDEFSKKSYFLRNYYHMEKDYISIWSNAQGKEREELQAKTKTMPYNEISFCYMDDVDFIKHQAELFDALIARKNELRDNFEYWKSAFVSEMWNHEYGINWQADYDTLSAFGRIPDSTDYEDTEAMFNDLGFTDTQRQAYKEARKEYFRQAEEKEAI